MVGGTDDTQENFWTWSSTNVNIVNVNEDDTYSYTNFEADPAYDVTKNCIWKTKTGKWSAASCAEKRFLLAFCYSLHSSYGINSITGNLCVKSQTKSNLSNFPRHPPKLLFAIQPRVCQNVKLGGLIRGQAAIRRCQVMR